MHRWWECQCTASHYGKEYGGSPPKLKIPLASVAQLIGASSHKQKVAGSIPGQGTYLGCRFDSHVHTISSLGAYGRQPMDASLSHQCFSASLPLSLKVMKKCPQVRVKIELLYGPAATLKGIYPKEMKSLAGRRLLHPYVLYSIILNNQDRETTKVSISGSMAKFYNLAIKKRWQCCKFVTTWMDLDNIMLSEVSQTERDKCSIVHL